MAQTTFTFRVDATIKDAFNHIAQENGRSASQSKEQESWDSWFQAKIEERIKEADTGQFLSSEEVEESSRKRRESLITRTSS